VEKIKRFLREGRLEIVGDSGNMFLECEGCGKAIRSGRYCSDCEREMSRDFFISLKPAWPVSFQSGPEQKFHVKIFKQE
jgi:predicted amidophosphoribosyltransferase